MASTKSEAEQEEAEEQIEDLISSFAHDLVKVNQGSNKETEDEEENEQDDDQEEVLIAGGVSNIRFVVLYPVFPQLKNKFPGMHSEISWNLTQFPEIEEGYSLHGVCYMPAKIHKLHNINALFKRIVHSLGVGPST